VSVTISNSGSGSIMAAARDIATDATTELHLPTDDTISLEVFTDDTISLVPPATGDPVDDLVAVIRPTAIRAVDAMQVAALLEARGYNDRTARVAFGYGDVFELAAEVFRRLGGHVQTLPVRKSATDWRRSLRDTFHGVLYLLPSALFPAVMATIAPDQLVVALVVAGTLGWVWAGGASWLAYQLRGLGDERTAGRVLACSSIAGLVAATGFAVLVATWTAGGLAVISLVLGVMVYQAASTLLVFYRGELWLATLMVPAAAAGTAYVVWGRDLLLWALGTASVCVVIVFCVGVHRAVRARPNAGPDAVAATTVRLRTVLRHHAGRLVAVLGYSALSAAFILHAQVPYLLHNVDVVFAGAPLIVTMGVVEWRARRVTELSRGLLGRVRYPRQFVVRQWLIISANVALCWLAVSAVAVVVLVVLARIGWLTPAGITMAAAQVVLAGAYMIAFLLAGYGRYGWLCVCLALALGAHVATAQLIVAMTLPPVLSPLEDVTMFLGSAVLLHILLLLGLVTVIGQVRRHR
jgi:hypothetical protein